MIRIPVSLDRTFRLAVNIEAVFALLSDIPEWGALFPRVESIEPLPAHGDDAWHWTMEPMGPPGYEAHTLYGCRYTIDPERHTVTWEPIDGVGNAQFSGAVELVEAASATKGTLHLDTELEIPAPRFARAIVQPAVAFEMGRLTDRFLERLHDAFSDDRVT